MECRGVALFFSSVTTFFLQLLGGYLLEAVLKPLTDFPPFPFSLIL